MEENNCIVINFPRGAKGHVIGRLLATCDNVVWYDYEGNGNPWSSYTSDNTFTQFHWNRRFKGSQGKGICQYTVEPVLEHARKRGLNQSLLDMQNIITKWSKKLAPNNFMYALHDPVPIVRQVFKTKKHIHVIPDIDKTIERFIQTGVHYFADIKNKDITYYTLYQNLSKETGRSINDLMYEDFSKKIKDLRENCIDTDFVLHDANELLDQEIFTILCRQFDLNFNEESFSKTVKFIKEGIIQ
tara:strand:- start:8652 stop:9380 length:729 start_codon:yes stop_codon:yes gene_type:complete